MATSPSVTASSTGSPRHPHEHDAPSVVLSDEQAATYRVLAREIVTRTLDQEMQFRYRDNETLDERDWKFVRSKERMRVYKRTPAAASLSASSAGMSGDSLLPMVLAVGCMEGTLEDALYGMHHKTTREMRSVTSFLNKSHLDAAVLANLETGTDEDPFRYLGLKWRVVQTPGPDAIVKNRDVLTLEHAGINIDASGNKYGFHLLKSVDHPDAPELAGNAQAAAAPHAVRAQVMVCFIYRQITPTRVGAYCKGIFTLGGEIMDFVSFFTAAEMVLGIAKALECAAAKRLTLLALQREVDMPLLLRSSTRLSKDMLEFTTTMLDNNPAASNSEPSKNMCAVCSKKRFFLGPPLRTCKICARAVCSKCCVKAPVFAKPRNLRILCCKACVLESRTLQVDPRDPQPVLALADEL